MKSKNKQSTGPLFWQKFDVIICYYIPEKTKLDEHMENVISLAASLKVGALLFC